MNCKVQYVVNIYECEKLKEQTSVKNDKQQFGLKVMNSCFYLSIVYISKLVENQCQTSLSSTLFFLN